MPWHVIVYDRTQKPDDPWLREDRVLREADFPDPDALLRAVARARAELEERYPPPDAVVVSGSGPEPDSPEFPAFVTWLLREC